MSHPPPFREYRTRLGNIVLRHEPCGEVITWMDGLARFGWGEYKRRWQREHQCPPRRKATQSAAPVATAPPAPTVEDHAE